VRLYWCQVIITTTFSLKFDFFYCSEGTDKSSPWHRRELSQTAASWVDGLRNENSLRKKNDQGVNLYRTEQTKFFVNGDKSFPFRPNVVTIPLQR
jgi:hypothetical protein